MHHDRVAAFVGSLQPEGGKSRELFTSWIGGLDREPAGRQAIALTFSHRPEIAGAEKRTDFVEVVRPVERVVKAKAGEADIAGRWRHLVEGEQIGTVAHLVCAAINDLED